MGTDLPHLASDLRQQAQSSRIFQRFSEPNVSPATILRPDTKATLLRGSLYITADGRRAGYGQMAERMVELAAQQPGFLGVETVRDANGFGITVSYWESEEAIVSWKSHMEHEGAQEAGKRVWYSDYQLRVAKVERDYRKAPTPPASPE